MNDFLRFFNYKVRYFPMHFDLYYCKTCDWTLEITKNGCAIDYPEANSEGEDVIIFRGSEPDLELLFAKAHVELKEWLIEYEGGY